MNAESGEVTATVLLRSDAGDNLTNVSRTLTQQSATSAAAAEPEGGAAGEASHTGGVASLSGTTETTAAVARAAWAGSGDGSHIALEDAAVAAVPPGQGSGSAAGHRVHTYYPPLTGRILPFPSVIAVAFQFDWADCICTCA